MSLSSSVAMDLAQVAARMPGAGHAVAGFAESVDCTKVHRFEVEMSDRRYDFAAVSEVVACAAAAALVAVAL